MVKGPKWRKKYFNPKIGKWIPFPPGEIQGNYANILVNEVNEGKAEEVDAQWTEFETDTPCFCITTSSPSPSLVPNHVCTTPCWRNRHCQPAKPSEKLANFISKFCWDYPRLVETQNRRQEGRAFHGHGCRWARDGMTLEWVLLIMGA